MRNMRGPGLDRSSSGYGPRHILESNAIATIDLRQNCWAMRERSDAQVDSLVRSDLRCCSDDGRLRARAAAAASASSADAAVRALLQSIEQDPGEDTTTSTEPPPPPETTTTTTTTPQPTTTTTTPDSTTSSSIPQDPTSSDDDHAAPEHEPGTTRRRPRRPHRNRDRRTADAEAPRHHQTAEAPRPICTGGLALVSGAISASVDPIEACQRRGSDRWSPSSSEPRAPVRSLRSFRPRSSLVSSR